MAYIGGLWELSPKKSMIIEIWDGDFSREEYGG
jgi:hypothetical protein